MTFRVGDGKRSDITLYGESEMKCPRDGTILSKVHVLGVELDKCHKCDGIWFDHGELEQIRDTATPGVEEYIEQKYGNPEFEADMVDGYMVCPSCDGKLMEFNYSWFKPVKVDTCQGCNGVWLDKGELATITEQKQTIDEHYSGQKLQKFLLDLCNKMRKKKKNK